MSLARSELKSLAAEGAIPPELALFENWKATQKHNVDEDAANTAKKRAPALMSINPHADGMGRAFGISADGERMGSHVTDVMCTDGAGGVGAPMVIKTRGGGDGAAEASRKRRLGQAVRLPPVKPADKKGLVDGDDAEDDQELNIEVRTSTNGSMTVELFIEWVDHFIEKILKPKGLGKGTRRSRHGRLSSAMVTADGHR